MATPHNEARTDEIAKIVLMPGDPLRAKFIADTYLTDVKEFNDVRNMLGFTGYYNGKKISVMGSGMGMPSIGIYSFELFKFYDVEKIIRVGSCGALVKNLDLFDLILASKACSESDYAFLQNGNTDEIIPASESLTNQIKETANKEGIKITEGNIYTTDVFDPYRETEEESPLIKKYKCIGAEMEAFALFHNAKRFQKEAACILTVTDSPFFKKEVTTEDRETGFSKMIELVLKALI